VFPLVIPIFLGAFRRADELALAVEARGYRCGRKRINEAKNSLHLRDIGALFLTLGVLVVQIFVF